MLTFLLTWFGSGLLCSCLGWYLDGDLKLKDLLLFIVCGYLTVAAFIHVYYKELKKKYFKDWGNTVILKARNRKPTNKKKTRRTKK